MTPRVLALRIPDPTSPPRMRSGAVGIGTRGPIVDAPQQNTRQHAVPVTARPSARLEISSPFYGPDGVRLTTLSGASYVGQGVLESPLHPHGEVASIMATIDQVREHALARGRVSR